MAAMKGYVISCLLFALTFASSTSDAWVSFSYDVLTPRAPVPELHEGGSYHKCIYSSVPSDQLYHAVEFQFIDGTNGGVESAAMYTISENAVSALTKLGIDFSQPFECNSKELILTAIQAGGFGTLKVSPGPGQAQHSLPSSYGIRMGLGSPRRHILMRVVYKPETSEQRDAGTGFRMKLTSQLRSVSVGEFQLATPISMGASALSIPAGESAYEHLAECNSETLGQIISKPMKLLQYKVQGGAHLTSFGLIESFEPGPAWLAKTGPTVCPFGFPQSVMPSKVGRSQAMIPEQSFKRDTSDDYIGLPHGTYLDPQNTYRLHCTYNTVNASSTTSGGTSSQDEVCSIRFYYEEEDHKDPPRVPFCLDFAPWELRTKTWSAWLKVALPSLLKKAASKLSQKLRGEAIQKDLVTAMIEC